MTIKEECILNKKRAAAIIAASILGLITLLYLSGVLGQLLINYELWMNSGGLTGQTTIGAVDWNPIVCLSSAFSIPGLKSIGTFQKKAVTLQTIKCLKENNLIFCNFLTY